MTFIGLVANGKELYVSDQLEAPVRAGSGDGFRIQKMLQSGTKVEEVGRSGSYVQIRYSGNVTGWMHQRFLLNEPIARELVEEAREELRSVSEYKKQINEQVETIQKLTLELNENRDITIDLENRLAEIMRTSENIFQIDERNKLLTQENHRLEVNLKALQQKHEVLEQSIRSKEWTVGALILFSGIIFGSVILPRLLARLRHKRTSWDL